MTKLLSALFVAAAAVTACQVEPIIDEPSDIMTTVRFSAEEIETRTVFDSPSSGSYPVLWTNSQQVRIFPSTSFASAKNASVTPSSDMKTAKFDAEFTFSETARVAFFMLSPASVFDSHVDGTTIKLTVPSKQTPADSTPDEKAQILVAGTPTYRPAPDNVKFSPKHFTAYMAVTFKNLPVTLGKTPVLTVTSESAALSGTVSYDMRAGTLTTTSASKSVSVAMKNYDGTCWIGCLPAQVSGTKLTFTIEGRTSSVSKTITVPTGKNLTAGKIAKMTIDLKETVAVTGVSLDQTSLSLGTGDTATLTATVTPSNATDKSVTWSSSNTAVATVSSTGVVTAVGSGNAVITVTTNDGGKTATCNVTVYLKHSRVEFLVREHPDADYSYDADENTFHMSTNSSKHLNYTMYYNDGTSAVNTSGTYSIVSGSGIRIDSSNNDIVCTAAGRTAVVRVTSDQDPDIHADMTIKTWDPATSISFSSWSSALPLWAPEGKNVIMRMKILPETARQKAVIYSQNSTADWTVSRFSAIEFQLTAPMVNGTSVDDYLQKALELKVTTQTGNCSCTVKWNITNLHLEAPKLFDIVTYNDSEKTYQTWDSGLRVLISSGGNYKDMYCESVSYTPNSGYSPVGIVTYYDPTVDIHSEARSSASGAPTIECFNSYSTISTSPNSTKFHGYAIALNDCADTYWSSNNYDVTTSEHWNVGLPADPGDIDGDRYGLNAFNLTVVGAYLNGVPGLGSANVIYPVDRVWRYVTAGFAGNDGFVYKVNAWPGTAQPDFDMRPWVVPTRNNFTMLNDGSGLINSSFVKKLNEMLTKAGGAKLFQNNSDTYWTINQYSSTHSVYIYYSSSIVWGQKQDVRKIRPFMVL